MTQVTVPADAPALIALDWGTSALRAYALGAAGQVLDSRRSAHGIMNLPQPSEPTDAAGSAASYEQALELLCGDWLRAWPQVPMLACGMVGSAQGWQEAAYQDLPVRIDALAGALTVVTRRLGQSLHIVPGLIERSPLPNVMRGEETQIAGVLQSLAGEGSLPERLLIGLPGTHSKWVRVAAGLITEFKTFMTGEVFAVLRQHSILGRTMASASNPDDEAFARGLRVAGSAEGRMGVLSNLFSCRTLGLTGHLRAEAQADYVSGLLIGHEVSALQREFVEPGTSVVLCGEPDLCRRYAEALTVYGCDTPCIRSDVTAAGLWRLARDAGLV
jgi:2-dehydro-3-deoxygalactonokinase